MCGRLSVADLSPAILEDQFRLDTLTAFRSSYNLAPSQQVPVVRQLNQSRCLDLLDWGLIPHWSKDKTIAAHTFNARLETLSQKPSFRDAFKSKRCIIPVSGFYEWRQEGRRKTPYYIFRLDKQPIALAGLWDCWESRKTGQQIESCAIITTAASHLLAEIHERMPAVLEAGHVDVWLDPGFRETGVLRDILTVAVPELEMYAVSAYLNKVEHDGVKCIEKAEE